MTTQGTGAPLRTFDVSLKRRFWTVQSALGLAIILGALHVGLPTPSEHWWFAVGAAATAALFLAGVVNMFVPLWRLRVLVYPDGISIRSAFTIHWVPWHHIANVDPRRIQMQSRGGYRSETWKCTVTLTDGSTLQLDHLDGMYPLIQVLRSRGGTEELDGLIQF